MGKQVAHKLLQWIEKIAYVLLTVILFDCMALGGGSYLKIRGIDIRMVWYGLFFLLSLPSVFRYFKKLLTNTYVLVLALWLAWLVVCTVKGFREGNDTGNIIANLIGFASFGILPGAIAVLSSKKRILGLMKVSVIATVFLATQTIALMWMHNLDGEFLIRINPRFLEIELGALSIVDQDLVRVFMRSHPLSILGCGSAIYLAIKSKNKLCFAACCAAAALGLMSVAMSFTRSLYLAVAVAAVVLLLAGLFALKKNMRKRLIAGVAATSVFFLVFLLCLNALFGTSILSYGVYRSVGYDLVSKMDEKFPDRLRVDLTPSPDEPYVLGGIAMKPVATEPTPTKPAETKPEETKPEETKPAETKPAETKPAETKPQETKPQETKPEETKPEETKPEETKSEETKPEETKPEETKPEETKPEETKPEETKPAETEPEPTTPVVTEPPVDHNKLSDDLRTATRMELLGKIKENLIVGHGMGVVLETREDKDGVNEYFYLDQIMKTGLIGIVLYMLPMLMMLLNLLFRKKHMEPGDIFICSIWLAALLGVAAFSYFNPYLNGSNGIVLYCCAIAVMSKFNGKQQIFGK